MLGRSYGYIWAAVFIGSMLVPGMLGPGGPPCDPGGLSNLSFTGNADVDLSTDRFCAFDIASRSCALLFDISTAILERNGS